MQRRLFISGLGVYALAALAACGGTTATATPAPTPTPAPVKSPDAATIVQRLKAAGLPVGDVIVWNATTDPNHLLGRPNQYISKATFRDTRLPATTSPSVDAGGDVEVFANDADLQVRKNYIEAITKSSSLLVEYVFTFNVAMLRLGHVLTPDQAAEYQKALTAAAK